MGLTIKDSDSMTKSAADMLAALDTGTPYTLHIQGIDDANDSAVAHPSHYTAGTLEVIDIIEAVIEANGTTGMPAFLTGTVIKYLCRYTHKGAPVEDLKKARWYLDRMIEEAKSHDEATS